MAQSMHTVEMFDWNAVICHFKSLSPAAARERNPRKAATEKGRKKTTHCDYSSEFMD